jgi:acyl carrier protein
MTTEYRRLAERTADLVVTASDGIVSREQALASGPTLTEQGLTSLAYLRLIDALETEFGVYIDLEDALNTVDSLVRHMLDQGATVAG